MRDWTESGGHLACPCDDCGTAKRTAEGTAKGTTQGTATRHRVGPVIIVLKLGFAALLLITSAQFAQARDPDGRYANSPLKQWFDGLRSGKGPCCSDADGSAVSDVDWESKDGHYRVRLDGQWIDVPDEAVITEPNRVGRAMVWPIRGYMGVTIRCFMPGSMT
ncbi:hypothetical protein [Bradyrhizobium jicamae]|uniref:hypothetical protein n=1 Tax=Bradyrhizobium jicamae TaxID=280332 RepID=UPI00390C91BE